MVRHDDACGRRWRAACIDKRRLIDELHGERAVRRWAQFVAELSCSVLDPCVVQGRAPFAPLAPEGTQTPGAPKVKTSFSARYTFPLMDYDAHVAGDFMYQTAVWSELRVNERAILGQQPAYGLANFSFGVKKDRHSIELFVKNAFDRRASLHRYAGCNPAICGPGSSYSVVAPPRLIGLQFGQQF